MLSPTGSTAEPLNKYIPSLLTNKCEFGTSVTALGPIIPICCLAFGTKNNGLPWSCNVTTLSDLYTAIIL